MIKKEFIKDYPIDKIIPYKRNPRILDVYYGNKKEICKNV